MYCKNCGSYIEPDQRVCPKCGEKIGKTKKKKGTIINRYFKFVCRMYGNNM